MGEWIKNLLKLQAIMFLAREIIITVSQGLAAKKRERLISYVEEILSAGDFPRPHRPPPKA